MSSKPQLDVCDHSQWRRYLVNAYEAEGRHAWCCVQVKMCDPCLNTWEVPQLGARLIRITFNFTFTFLHTDNKVEFNTVDFVESRQSQPCCFGPVHTGDQSRKNVRHSGDRVDRISNKVDRVCNTADRVGNEIQRIGDSRLCADLSPVSEIVDFVAVCTGL